MVSISISQSSTSSFSSLTDQHLVFRVQLKVVLITRDIELHDDRSNLALPSWLLLGMWTNLSIGTKPPLLRGFHSRFSKSRSGHDTLQYFKKSRHHQNSYDSGNTNLVLLAILAVIVMRFTGDVRGDRCICVVSFCESHARCNATFSSTYDFHFIAKFQFCVIPPNLSSVLVIKNAASGSLKNVAVHVHAVQRALSPGSHSEGMSQPHYFLWFPQSWPYHNQSYLWKGVHP